MNFTGYLHERHVRKIPSPIIKDVFLSHLEFLSSKIKTKSQLYYRETNANSKKILKKSYLDIDVAEHKDAIFDYYRILKSKKAAIFKAEQEEIKRKTEFVTEILDDIIEAALVAELVLDDCSIIEDDEIQVELTDIVKPVGVINPPREPLYLLEDCSAFSRSRWIAAAMRQRTKSNMFRFAQAKSLLSSGLKMKLPQPKLPSRNKSIFLGSVGAIAGTVYYDKSERKRIQSELIKKASVIADTPAEWNEPSRCVKVILESTSWSKYWFDEFVKPVFDAGALDYELVDLKESPQIIETARNIIWDAKDQQQKEINDKLETQELNKKQGWFVDNLTLEEQEKEYSKLEQNHIKLYVPHLHKPVYDDKIGMVAMGPISWRYMLYGLEYGSFTQPTESREFGVIEEKNIEYLDNSYANPALGYITSFNRVGFSNWGNRIAGWFTRRYQAKSMGEQALKIVLGNTRPFESIDQELGSECYEQPEIKDEKDMKPLEKELKVWTEDAEKHKLDSLLLEKLNIYI